MNINLNNNKGATALLTLAIAFGLPGSFQAARSATDRVCDKAIAREYRPELRLERSKTWDARVLAGNCDIEDQDVATGVRDRAADVRYDRPECRSARAEGNDRLDIEDLKAQRAVIREGLRDQRATRGHPADGFNSIEPSDRLG